jgi:probable F420-dependent oxidoreductase
VIPDGFELGVALPNYGPPASVEGVSEVAEAAVQLGFDSVWATEHFVVAEDVADPYGTVLDPFVILAHLAARTDGLALGTSIVLLPLRNPFHLAKEAVTLQAISGRRLRLGVGVGWHEPEFAYMGFEFAGRGRRADEAIRLMRALWAGETGFSGERWSFGGAVFGPLPDEPPEIWIGGAGRRSLRRARELGDAWHPNRIDRELIAEAKQAGLRVIPRVRVGFAGATPPLSGTSDEIAGGLRELIGLGIDGAVFVFGRAPGEIVTGIRRFAEEISPRL